MKLLIAADIFPPESGGPATYSVTLANELVKQGVEVKIVSLNPDGDKHVTRNTYHVTQRQKVLRYVNLFWLLFKHAKDVDVMYAMGPVNAGLPALIVSRLLRKRFVVKVVGDYAWEQWQQRTRSNEQGTVFVSVDDFQKMGVGGKIRVLKKIERFVCKRAGAVITPSQYLKKIVSGWGVDYEKIKVIRNEVDYIQGVPIAHSGEKWLVSVGRLTSWKGMDTLIDVISDISKQEPALSWKLKIVGDGPEMENLKSKVKNLKLEHIVELTGNLPKEKTLAYMASADVFILNSGYEGLSHVIVEAMNQGVPVLASRAGGNDEMVEGEALFTYNDKEEIKKKVVVFGLISKRESIPHTFGMIDNTKKLLEEICAP